MTDLQWYLHPWSLLVYQTSLIVFAVGFTRPGSLIRLALWPLALFTVFRFVATAHVLNNGFHMSFGASDAWLTFLQYWDVVLLSNWDFEYGGPQPKVMEKREAKPWRERATFWNRLGFGIYAASSYRCSGTPFEVPNLGPFDKKDPKYVPSKAKYIRNAAIRVVVVYLILDAMTSFNDPTAMRSVFADEKIPLLRRLSQLTLEEAIMRTFTSFSFWLVNYLVLILFFDIPGIICVATGLSGVEWWRPPFNSIFQAFTLRRYWGVFWHQSVRKRINSPANWIAKDVLRLPRGTLLARYAVVILTFTMSTFQHATGDIASGIPVSRTGSPWFFLVQALGFVLEDVFQYVWKQVAPASARDTWYTKVFGYVWVFAWMFWCTPFYAYPVSANNRGDQDAILPFSVLKAVLGK
ncbi:tat pathway signal sequence [Colletotrichum paranaense]|uniref:Tat pathway signal sequence n=1 Tax=Colletotrichum paranaense TaxID=1914294 RepID=A0ABQ9SNR2_9PEZI|nr:tat pathway signal sequence [Colletotrichum paranaense]KAK1541151.1 tat pathway signal sequence [Colletotrichum paranaense]